jgi:hypothetical protein
MKAEAGTKRRLIKQAAFYEMLGIRGFRPVKTDGERKFGGLRLKVQERRWFDDDNGAF